MATVAVLVCALVAGTTALTAEAATRPPLSSRVLLGAWVPGSTVDARRFEAFEARVGGRMDIASLFYGFGDVFPSEREAALSARGARRLLLSWDMGSSRFSAWASGAHDAYLRTIGVAAARFGRPVYVRPWPEMNGDWQRFQPTARGERSAGGTPAEFRRAWRHVVTTVRAAGGTNVRWVFNPYAATYRGTTDVRSIWPGRAYVDVLGMDGYNWGGGPPGRWTSFARTFGPMYRILTRLHPTAPVWVCETASKEPRASDGAARLATRSKATWIRKAFSSRAFPRLQAVVWFHERKERDWRVDSSAASLRAFRAVVDARDRARAAARR